MAGNLILRANIASVVEPQDDILWETAFEAVTDVVNWIWNSDVGGFDPTQVGSDSQRITHRPNEGPVFGKHAMRIEDTTGAGDEIHSLWGRTFDATKTSGDNSFSYVVPPGTPIYVRGRLKISQERMDNDNGTGMKIVSITASANHTNTNQECFLGRLNGHLNPSIIGATSAFPKWDQIDLGGGDFDLMPGYNGGSSCLYSDVVGSGDYTGCWVLRAEEWMNFQITLIGGGVGSANNTYCKLEMAYLEDTTWTTVFERSNLNISSDSGGYEFCNGHAALCLWNRNEDHDELPPGCYHWFTDIRTSLTHSDPFTAIARPPSWFRDAVVLRPFNIPGTSTGTPLAANASIPSNWMSFNGMAVDQISRKLHMTGNGGHACDAGNEDYYLDLTQESCAWVRQNTGSNRTGGSDPSVVNLNGDYADGSKKSDHTYNTEVCVAPGEILFGCVAAPDTSGTSEDSSACWVWRESDLSNGRHGYTFLGKAHSTWSSQLSMVNSCACYDYRDGKYWIVTQNAFQAPNGVWSIDRNNSYAITTYGGYDGFLEFPVWCCIVPDLNVLLVGTTENTIHRMSLSSPGTWDECTVNGSGIDDYYYHAAYYEQGRQVIGWMEDGNFIRVLSVPSTAGGTYTWNLIGLTGGGVTIPDTPGPGEDEGGTQSRFNVVGNMGTGEGMIVYQRSRSAPCIGIKLPAGPIT
jgi:hypothetical protein